MTRSLAEFSRAPLALAPGFNGAAAQRRGRDAGTGVRGRFVTESHALGAAPASPQAILIAVAVAVAVYLLGRRISA